MLVRKLRVEVYRNLKSKKTPLYSIRSCKSGIVLAHVDHVCLANVKFVCLKTGRDKVRSTKQKNVHAFLVGDVEFHSMARWIEHKMPVHHAVYNPYKNDTWEVNSKPVAKADMAVLSFVDGKSVVMVRGING